MRRKVLLSLLAAAGTPGALLANVDLTNGLNNWQQSGFSDGNSVDLSQLPGGSVTVTQSVEGTIFVTTTCKFAATYEVALDSRTNVKIQVTGEGVKDNGDGTFTTSQSNTEVTIKLSSANGYEGFDFAGVTLYLVTDFSALQTALNEKLENLEAETVEGSGAEAQALNETAQDLNDQISQAKDDVAKLDAITTEEEYGDLIGNDPKNPIIEQTVDKLVSAVIAHNNDVWNMNIKLASLDGLNNSLTIVNTVNSYILEQLGEGNTFPSQKLQKGCNELLPLLKAALETVQSDWKKAEDDDELLPEDYYDQKWKALADQADQLLQEYLGVKNLVDNYNTWLSNPSENSSDCDDVADLNAKKGAVDEALGEFTQNNAVAAAKEKVQGIYDQCFEDMPIKEGNYESATDSNLSESQSLIATAIGAMEAELEEIQTLASGNAGNADTLNDLINQLQQKLDETDGAEATETAEAVVGWLEKTKTEMDKLDKQLSEFQANNVNYPEYVKSAVGYQEVIDDLDQEIKNQLAAYGLTEETTQDLVERIGNLMIELEALAANAEANYKAQVAYTANTKAIQNYLKLLGIARTAVYKAQGTNPKWNIVDAFAGAYSNIYNAFDALQKNANELMQANEEKLFGEDDYSYSENIKEYKDEALAANTLFNTNLQGLVNSANTALSTYASKINALATQNNYIARDTEFAVDVDPFNELYNDYDALIKAFTDNIKGNYDLLSTSVQSGMDGATELYADGQGLATENGELLLTTIKLSTADLVIAVTEANMEVLKSDYDKKSEELEAAQDMAGYGDLLATLKGYDNSKNYLQNQVDNLKRVTIANKTVINTGTLDNEIRALDVKINALNVEKLIDNQNSYDALQALLQTLDSDLSRFREAIDKDATVPSVVAWNAVYDKTSEDMANVAEQIEASYKAIELNAKPTGEQKEKDEIYTAEINRISDLVNKVYLGSEGTPGSILWNELNYANSNTNYTDALKSVSDAIVKIQTDFAEGLDLKVKFQLEAYDIDYEGTYEGVIETLLQPLPAEANEQHAKDVENFTNLEAGDYLNADGEWVKNYSDSEAAYAAIEAEVKAILEALATDYANAVIEKNKATATEVFGSLPLEALESQYKAAVDLWNGYYDANENQAYHNGLSEGVLYQEEHRKLFTYATPIHDLAQAINDYMASVVKLGATSDADAQILTKGDFEAQSFELDGETMNFVSAYKAIKAFIDNYGDNLSAQVQAYAKQYYKDALASARQIISDEEKALKNAGVPDAYWSDVETANSNVTKAEAAYSDTMEQADYVDGELSLDMDAILKWLDRVTPESFDNEKMSGNAWNGTEPEGLYSQALAQVEEYITTVEGYKDADMTSYLASLNEIKSQMESLNDEEKEYVTDKTLFENFSYLLSRLNELEATAEGAYNEATAAEDQAVAVAQQKADWETELESLREDYNDLRNDLFNSNVDYSNYDTTGIGTAIDNLAAAIENYTGDNTDKQNIEGAFSSIEASIEKAYKNAYEELQGSVQKMIDNLETDWNNKYAGGETSTEDLDAYRTAIDQLISDVATINDEASTSYEDALEKLNGVEQQAVELSKSNGVEVTEPENPADKRAEAISQLDSLAESVNGVIDLAQTALDEAKTIQEDESVKAKYQGLIDALSSRVEEVKAAYNADTVLVDQVGVFESQLDAVSTDALNLQSQIVEENQTMSNSNANYTRLSEQLSGVEEQYDNLKTILAGYNAPKATADNYTERLQQIDEYFTEVKAQLAERKAEYTITNNDELPWIENVEDEINDILNSASNRQIRYDVSLAATAVEEAYNSINDGTRHVNQSELDSQIADLEDQLNDLQTESAHVVDYVNQANGDNEDSLVSRARELVLAANALQAVSEEGSVKAGDVENDGNIDVFDYVALLDMILSNPTYDDSSKAQVAGDINQDKRLNVQDLVALLNLISGRDVQNVRVAMAAPAPCRSTELNVVKTIQNGNRTLLAFEFTNLPVELGAMQLDLMIPSGMEVVNEYLGEQAANLVLSSNDYESGSHRIVISSPDMNMIKSGAGAVLYVEVKGHGEVGVQNAMGADSNASSVGIDISGAETTGATTLTDDLKNGIDYIYDAGGRLYKKMQRGINIIRRGNGDTEKVIKKD